MDFSSMLQYLQSLLGARQQQSSNQFGQNLGLQQQELAQQGSQFDKNLGFQQQQLGQQGSEFDKNLALQKQIQDQANALAQGEFGLQANNQAFNQGESRRLNVTPGSTLWQQIQEMTNPNSPSNLAFQKMLGTRAAAGAPLSSKPLVTFTPAGPEWRIS